MREVVVGTGHRWRVWEMGQPVGCPNSLPVRREEIKDRVRIGLRRVAYGAVKLRNCCKEMRPPGRRD